MRIEFDSASIWEYIRKYAGAVITWTVLLVLVLYVGRCNYNDWEQSKLDQAKALETDARDEGEINTALIAYLSQNAPGWSLVGKDRASVLDLRDKIVHIDLRKGTEDTVISLHASRFQREDKSQYWLIYEVTGADEKNLNKSDE